MLESEINVSYKHLRSYLYRKWQAVKQYRPAKEKFSLKLFPLQIPTNKYNLYILYLKLIYNFGFGPGATFIPAIGTDKAICVAVSKIIDFSLQLG